MMELFRQVSTSAQTEHTGTAIDGLNRMVRLVTALTSLPAVFVWPDKTAQVFNARVTLPEEYWLVLGALSASILQAGCR